MRIGVDGWRLQGRRTGVGTYLARVLAEWDADLLPAGATVTVYVPAALGEGAPRLPENVRVRVLGPRLDMLPWQTLRLGPFTRDDVLLCPSYTKPLLARSPTVVVMFEATQKRFPGHYPRRTRWVQSPLHGLSGRGAAFVVAPTDAARDDIMDAYRVRRERMRVVPMAPGAEFRPLPDAAAREAVRRRILGGPEPCLLHVGKLTRRRNVPTLMRGFARFKRTMRTDHRLVVVGLPTLDLDLPALARALDIEASFRYFEYLPLEDLVALFAAADAFVLPYTYEAVSLTALEAQAAGTPVVTTDTPGLREQTGGAALYLDGVSDEIVADGMARLVADPVLQARLRRDGAAHAREFTWRSTAAGLLGVLAEAARQGAA